MTSSVRLGIIGTGLILDRFLAGAARSAVIDVVAIASRDAERGLAALYESAATGRATPVG